MTDPIVLPLDVQAPLAFVGGKALNLSRLVRAGFPVPPGFIVPTTAYERFVQVNGLATEILDQVQDLPGDDPAALEAASSAIRAQFSTGTIPAEVATSLRIAYAGLGQPPAAVRSSATAEDLPGFSFAGQQDTFLHVIGEEALQQAVIDCWSSLWTARAVGYRARAGIDHATASLAVIVQEMVPSECSGVLFTANPLTGVRSETVIDATFGLGEALVSGQVEPDHYVVDARGEILSKTMGAKATAIYGRPGGGTVTVPTNTGGHAGMAAGRQALPDAAIRELARMGRRVAELFGAPQDVEWARARGRLYLLQARPITTLYPLPEGMPAEPLRALVSFGAIQGMLDPMTPLGRDAICTTLIGAGKVFGAHLTLETQSVLWEAGERLWVNLSGLVRNRLGRRLALATLPSVAPGASQALRGTIDQGRFGPPGPLRARTAWRISRVLIPMIARALRTVLRPDAERERLFRLLEEMLFDFQARLAQAADPPERLALIRRMADRAFEFVIPQFVPRFGAGMATFNLLSRLAASVPEEAIDVRVMMRAVPHNVTTEMDLVLWETAQAIRADPESLAHFQVCKAAALADDYLQGSLPAAAQGTIEVFMERYGMRGLAEIDLGRPRWREEPLPVLQTLRGYLEVTEGNQAPDAVYERGKRTAEAEVERLARALCETRGGWIKARLARAAAYRMRALIGLREAPKFAVVRILGLMRQALLADGAQWAAEGLLARPEDVFALHMRELESLAAGLSPVKGQTCRCRQAWAALAQDRLQVMAQEKRRRQIPRLLLSDGQAFYEGASGSQEGDGRTLRGDPVSPGTIEGLVRVVLDPRHAQLAPGEILVCPGTDPSWTPLFLTAGGLVMEVGGMMTHGAVVAREYGLPAVVGVHEATRRLRTGQRVRVDGSSGQVVLLEVSARPGRTARAAPWDSPA